MRHLTIRARLYIVGSYLISLAALAWLVFAFSWQELTQADWILGAIIAAGAAICQILVVARSSTTGERSDHLTPAPIFAALMLLPSPILALILIITWLPEWYFHRRSWYIQLWNISAYLIAATLARMALLAMTGYEHIDQPAELLVTNPVQVLALIPIFLATQTILLALVLKLARGRSFRDSGLFTPDKILGEVSIVCVGLGFALAWLFSPIYGVATALPLVLVFQALHVPNLREEASSDPKTGLANMRHFKGVISRTLDRAERSSEPFSILMCDLDYLRNINNTYGHAAGDIVLIGIANIIRRHVRANDLGARFGGEEFLVLLSETNTEAAQEVAERLRAELEATRFVVDRLRTPISATLSIGAASYPRDGRTAEAILHEADLAVYQAKRDGRNRVVVAGRESRELAAEWAREHLVTIPGDIVGPPAAEPRPLWNFINQITRTSISTEVGSLAAMRQPASTATTISASVRQQPVRSAPSPTVLVLITLIVLAAILSLLPGLSLINIPWAPLALFAGLTILASEVSVDTYGRGRTSVSVVAILSAALLFGPLGILAATAASAITLMIKARSPLHRMLFNFGTFVLSAVGAHGLFVLLVGGGLAGVPISRMIVPAILAGLVYYAINHLLLSTVRGLTERRQPWNVWQVEYRWLWPHYAVLGALSLIVALGYLAFGLIGVLALTAPVGMMHLAIKQYMDRSTVHMAELSQLNDRLSDSYEATLLALSHALDTRDEETEEHSQRVRRYTEMIARQMHMGQNELDDILRGALLHDIGKIGVPDAILLKPGRLTDEETTLMRKHPEIGYNMIAHIPFLSGASRVVLHHHEAYDGSGYPSGLSGVNIPLGARIFAIADTFDAMTSDRPYRAALPATAAIAEIIACSNAQFDSVVVAAFQNISISELMSVRGEFPSQSGSDGSDAVANVSPSTLNPTMA